MSTTPVARRRGNLVLRSAAALVALAAAVTPLVALWVAPAALLVAAGVVGASVLLRPPRGSAWLGINLVPRGLLIGGVCLLCSAEAVVMSGLLGAVAAATLLIAALVGEVFLRPAAGFRPPVAAGIGLNIAFPRPGPPAWLAVAASLAATVGGIVIGALGAPGWWWLLVSLAACIPLARIAAETRGNLAAARVIRERLPKAVSRHAPTLVLRAAPAEDPSAVLTAWLPVLREVGESFVVVACDTEVARTIAAAHRVAVVEVRDSADLAALDVASVRAALFLDTSTLFLVLGGLSDLVQDLAPEQLTELGHLSEENSADGLVDTLRALLGDKT